jgi:NADPH2:quinone reductase
LDDVLALCAQGKLRPLVSATYPLEDAARAMRSITGRQITGKVVLVN